MDTNEFIQKFRSRYLWSNLAAMAAVLLILTVGVKFGIDLYTHHGEAVSIPDVRRHSLEDSQHILEDAGFEVVVADTGYVKNLPPGTVLEQTPLPGTVVKTGRIVYLTINATDSPMLTLPDIIDNCSLREAQAKLTSMGFKLGPPQYVSGEKDWVYGVKCGGHSIVAGARVSVDDVLIIQVGDGTRNASDSLYVTDPEYEESEEEPMPDNGDVDNFEVVDGI